MVIMHVTAEYIPSTTKQWWIFRLDGLTLNLHGGQQSATLLNGSVMVFQENHHYTLWISTEDGNSTRLKEFLGKQVYRHLVSLVLRWATPTSSLDELQGRLQDELDRQWTRLCGRPGLLTV